MNNLEFYITDVVCGRYISAFLLKLSSVMWKVFKRLLGSIRKKSQQPADQDHPKLDPLNRPTLFRYPKAKRRCGIFGCPESRFTSSIRTLRCCRGAICEQCEKNLRTDADDFLICAFCRKPYNFRRMCEKRRNPKRKCRKGK